jgi:hypothetical protein
VSGASAGTACGATFTGMAMVVSRTGAPGSTAVSVPRIGASILADPSSDTIMGPEPKPEEGAVAAM